MGKDCGKHGECERRKLYRRAFGCLLALIILVLFVVLVVWLVLRPTKPKFYLQDATVYQLNLSTPDNILSSVIQVTVSSRNPNDRIGIYYDRVDVYASYRYQQITLSSELPPVYQGHNDIDVWSPYLYGAAVPVAPYLADALQQDCAAGFLLVHIKIDGRIRWKVGSWISGHYHLFANCPVFLATRAGDTGSLPSFKFQQMAACSVDV